MRHGLKLQVKGHNISREVDIVAEFQTQILSDHDEETQKDKYLSFNLDNESYGIEIKYVKEIIGIQPITELPELPEHIRGIIYLRGQIIPVMDVRLRFKKSHQEYNGRRCIIVIDVNGLSTGLIVDSVDEVVKIKEGDVTPPPKINNLGNRMIKGIGKFGERIILLLDCEMLLNQQMAEKNMKGIQL